MDWVGVLSLASGVILSGIAISISIKFYLETAALERTMVQTLAKIEALSLGIQQIQNDLIRSAWERHVAGSGLDLLTPMEVTVDPLEGPQPELGEPVSAQTEREAEQDYEHEQKITHEPTALDRVLRRIMGLDFEAAVALRIVLEYPSVPLPIVEFSKEDPMVARSYLFRPPDELHSLPLASFEEALQSLVDAGIVREVRQDDKATRLFVRFDKDFARYWIDHSDSIDRILHLGATVQLTRKRFDAADTVAQRHSAEAE
jgi:hypothetical protein